MNDSEQNWISKALEGRGHKILRSESLKAEASHRKFYRLYAKIDTFVLMVSPPALENNTQFMNLSRIFNDHELPVPKVIDFSHDLGYFLLTDVGNRHYSEVYDTPTEKRAISAAIKALVELQKIQHNTIPNYTAKRFAEELAIFDDWVIEQLLGDRFERISGTQGSQILIDQTQEQNQVCVHRDYHSRNLLLFGSELGIVDFQDALIGPAFYDLASLLYDCYHNFEESKVNTYLAYFLRNSPSGKTTPVAMAKRWLELTALQRQIKAMGIFARLHFRDKKISHLKYIPPVLDKTIVLMSNYPELKQTENLLASLSHLLKTKIYQLI